MAEVCQNKSITDWLAQFAPTDYKQYKSGLKGANIVRQAKLDPTTAFNNDARVFQIVGFMGTGKLMTHTILMRKDQGKIWAMNPDGATDTEYSEWDRKLPGRTTELGQLCWKSVPLCRYCLPRLEKVTPCKRHLMPYSPG